LSESGNVDQELLNDISNGLKNENPYCKDLQQLEIRVQQGGLTADANVVPRMVDQPPHMAMSVCAVMNCRWTGVMSLQVTTTNGSISDVKMNLEHVDGLFIHSCFHMKSLDLQMKYRIVYLQRIM
jgi:hypothetical protein